MIFGTQFDGTTNSYYNCITCQQFNFTVDSTSVIADA
jgi:hypothetical protein